jgi:uncharacterized protein (TIGR02246 family)
MATQAENGQARQAVESTNSKWNEAFNRGDAAAVAALYARDAVLLPPTHDVIRGSKEIQDFWASLIQAGFGEHAIETIEVHGQGSLLYQAGKWSATGKTKDGSRQSYGGSVVNIFERQSDGSWKSRLHSWN